MTTSWPEGVGSARNSALEVYLLRHTRTHWNDLSRYQGRLDAELSQEGLNQVDLIAGLVRPGEFDRVFSSPLLRARVLGERIADAAQVELTIDERITEIDMGPWQGLYRWQIEEQFPEMLQLWHEHSDDVQFPGGERLADVAARVDAFMNDLFGRPELTRVAVVSHDAVVKVALMLPLGLDLRHLHRFRMRNGSVSILRGQNYVGSVESIDSVAHLTGSPFRLGSS